MFKKFYAPMSFWDFLKFLLKTQGVIPALVSFVGTLLSLAFGKYLPSPDLITQFLALLTLLLTAWAGYKVGVMLERFRATTRAAVKDRPFRERR